MTKRTRRKPRLDAILSAVSPPLFLVGRRRNVIFINAGLERLSGWTHDDIVGEKCDYASVESVETVETLTSVLCPPPELFDGEQTSVPCYIHPKSGEPLPRMIHFFPLLEINERGEEYVDAVLGIVDCIDSQIKTKDTQPHQLLHAELAALRMSLRQRFGLSTLVCKSSAMQRVLAQVEVACQTQVSVLIVGEEGTGKEHIARLIHEERLKTIGQESPTSGRAFVPLDCELISPREMRRTLKPLLTPEEDQSSQPAASLRPGTLCLLNAETLSHDSQELLINAFTQSNNSSLASLKGLIATSKTEFAELLSDQIWREEFGHLVSTLKIDVPPLRARIEDIPLLAQFFLERANLGSGDSKSGLTQETIAAFERYNWPGNVAELQQVVQEAYDTAAELQIRLTDLPFRFQAGLSAQAESPVRSTPSVDLETILRQSEMEYIQWALAETGQNKSKAATLLGMTRAKFYRRLEQLGIADA